MAKNKTLRKSFSVACIGASAGGLEALTQLFNVMPKQINMAFVLVQHLEPHHKSILSEILSRSTALSIGQAKNNTKIKPGHVYVIPPNSYLSVSHRTLKVTPRSKNKSVKYLPIDFFMVSLAKAYGKLAIGIVLSGTGSDGTGGSKAIKAFGGITFAQDEKTAKYFGMPSSAIDAGSIDLVLSPEEIAEKLAGLAAHKYKAELKPQKEKRLDKEEAFNKILILLKDISGTDFSHYKRTTIERRITKRMGIHKLESYNDYYNYLREIPQEPHFLYKDILIPVTTFFRDPKIYLTARKKIFPFLMKGRRPQEHIRVWVPACSTGEEVYSIAISLYEFLEDNKIKPYFQIFGTDLNEAQIEKARQGTYKEDISAHVSALRLRRFFTKTEKGYKIAKQIRDRCVFARQDITSDPPLSNMDIVSCRNFLIYLDTFFQNKVLATLYYALKPQGFLILGTSESITSIADRFSVVSKKYKIYLKNIPGRKRPAPGARATVSKLKSSGFSINGAAQKEVTPKARRAHANNIIKKAAAVRTPELREAKSGGKKPAKLETKLAQTEKKLFAIIDEKDTFNEELKAATEEIQSANEELQSTNEELETSKEELQSTNEELLTVNDELQNKNTELSGLNNDLANILTSVNIPLIIVRSDLRIMRFTPMARKVMNLIPTDVGRPIGDIKLNINIPDLEKTLLEVIENTIPVETEVQDHDGRRYSMRVKPYKTQDNKIDGAVISLIDIDVIKCAQDELKDALDYADSIIETVREPLIIINKDLRVLSANKSFYETFVATAQNIENKPVSRIMGRKLDIGEFQKLLKKILPGKTYFNNFEMALKLPAKGKRVVSISARQIYLRGKEKQMILMSLEDITDRKRAEDILKGDKEKTQKLLDLQNKLEISKRLSDIGTLAATVAHEMRNPLATIKTTAFNIIRKVKDPPLIKRYIDIIDKKVEEGNQIINNLLFYSRSRPPSYENVNVNRVVKECVELAKGQCRHKSILFKSVNFKKYILMEADPAQLKELFSNILNNACDAVRETGGKIEISSRIKGPFVEIVIKDNGAGIAKEHLAKVFDAFFTTKTKGTGLGLTISRQIVTLHGGLIRIESKPGVETKVFVTLPRERKNNG